MCRWFLLCISALAFETLGLPAGEANADVWWPLDPQTSTHDVFKTYGQHAGPGPFQWGRTNVFHPGIDIPRVAGQPRDVKAVEEGEVLQIRLKGGVPGCYLVIGSRETQLGFLYGHLDPNSIPDRLRVLYAHVGRSEFLGRVGWWPWPLDPDHLEFWRAKAWTEAQTAQKKKRPVGNPLVHLGPNWDICVPELVRVWYRTNEPDRDWYTRFELTRGIEGDVDIVIQARDHVPEYNDWEPALYGIGYEVDGPGDHDIPMRTFIKFGDDTLPNDSLLFVVYDRERHHRLLLPNYHSYIVTNKDYQSLSCPYDSQYCWHTNQKKGGGPGEPAQSNDEAEYPDGEYRVWAYMTDYHDGLERTIKDSDGIVIVDNFIPKVDRTDPADGQQNVLPMTSITVYFSEPMNRPSCQSAFHINPPVTGAFSWEDDTTMVFDPDNPLDPQTYTATVTREARDLATNRLSAEYSWSFTVVDELLIYVVDDYNCIFRVLGLDGVPRRTWTVDPDDYLIRDICVDRSKNCYALGDDWNAGINIVLKFNSEGQLVATYPLEYNAQWRCITTDNTHYYVGGDGKVLKYECATGVYKGDWQVGTYSPGEITYSYYSYLLYVYNWTGSLNRSLVEAWPTTGGAPVYVSDEDDWLPTGLSVDDVGVYSCGVLWDSNPRSAGIRVFDLDLSQEVHYWEQEPDWCSDQLEILGDNILCIEFPLVLPPWPALKLRDKSDGQYVRDIYQFDDLVPFSMAVYDPSLPLGAGNLPRPEGGERTLSFNDGRSLLRPERFSLLQNFPNPVVESATIGYAVPHEASVELKIYDVGGGLVRTLVDRSMGPGYYSVDWDGRDILGRPVPGGVYFYRLVARDFTATRKMVVLR